MIRRPARSLLSPYTTLFRSAAGAWFAFSPAKAQAGQDAKLRARKDKLLNDVVALERKRRQMALSPAEEAKLQRSEGTRLNSSHLVISYAVFCVKKKNSTTSD